MTKNLLLARKLHLIIEISINIQFLYFSNNDKIILTSLIGGEAMGENDIDIIDYYKIGFRIGEKRRECGLTQEALADIINKTAKHVSAIENGRSKPNLPTLLKISSALNVTVDYFTLGIFRDKDVKNITELLQLCRNEDLPIIKDIVQSFVDHNLNRK